MHILSKNIVIAIIFIIAIAILKAKATLSYISKLILASKRKIEYYKSYELNIIYKSGILSIIINAYN